ncbi:acyltransferase family protein [Paracoccaceae bacterium GXU_MW_L88]
MIKPLHGLRGIAALTVVVGHFTYKGAASLGVVLFFVLSGFLIGKLYMEKDFTVENIWRYVVARFARVYPLFAIVIIATALINASTSLDIFGLQLRDVPSHLLFAGDARTVWTISTEFQFYALFVVVWALRSRLPSAIAAVLPLLALFIIVAVLLGTEASRNGIFGYLHIFLVGVLLAIIAGRDDGTYQNIAALAIPLCAVAYMAAYLLVPQLYQPRWIYLDPVTIAICASLVISTVVGGNCFANRVLSHPFPVWLGEISFGVYLLHRHVQHAVDAVWPGEPSALASFLPKLLLTLLLAQLANWLIERPCRAWLRQAGERINLRNSRAMRN